MQLSSFIYKELESRALNSWRDPNKYNPGSFELQIEILVQSISSYVLKLYCTGLDRNFSLRLESPRLIVPLIKCSWLLISSLLYRYDISGKRFLSSVLVYYPSLKNKFHVWNTQSAKLHARQYEFVISPKCTFYNEISG